MLSQSTKVFAGILIALTLQGCVTMGSQRFALKPETITSNYAQVKQIVLEEAANNGFKELTSEIRPSEYNGYEGRLFFQLKTPAGTDQLFVDFKKTDVGVSVNVHGAGTRSNPDSAAKAIQARLSRL